MINSNNVDININVRDYFKTNPTILLNSQRTGWPECLCARAGLFTSWCGM